jgi:hypothetical protein
VSNQFMFVSLCCVLLWCIIHTPSTKHPPSTAHLPVCPRLHPSHLYAAQPLPHP